ncbi:MAG: RNA polymerase sigma-70 factor [Bacteroidota bacterium]
MNNHPIEAWSKEIKRGNRLAFSNFFRAYYPVYVSFACRYVDAKPQACDLVQDAFVTLWERRDELEPEKSLTSFMYTIIRNAALNHIRDYESKYAQLTETQWVHLNETSAEEDETASNDQLVRDLINQLPIRQKEAFELSRFDGLQHDEIAQIMDVSPRTVNNHIVAALKTLRSAYDKIKNQPMVI